MLPAASKKLAKPIRALLLLVLTLYWQPSTSLGVSNPGAYLDLETKTKQDAKLKLQEVLDRYCSQYCQVIKLEAQIDEKIPDGEDMGFESAIDPSVKSQLIVSSLKATVQIDERVGAVNRDRLAGILKIHLNSITLKPEIIWKPVKLPNINTYGQAEPGYLFDTFDESSLGDGDWDFRPQDYTGRALQLRNGLHDRLMGSLNQVISRYCPNECIIEKIEILGHMVTPKEAAHLNQAQQVRDKAGRSIFQIDNIEIDITLDAKLSQTARDQIANLMRSKVRYASPVNFNIGVIGFPESYATKMERERQDINDPYGLNKLRQMLIMFRELAGTKEIVQTTNSSENQRTKDTTARNTNSMSDMQGMDTEDVAVLTMIGLLSLGLVAYLIMKVRQSRRDAQEMMMMPQMRQPGYDDYERQRPRARSSDEDNEAEPVKATDADTKDSLTLRIKIEELKEELIELFVENPKVAKETFSRFIKEDGVEETAKYVHVFGHLIVFELLKDPNFQRDLYELSEYYHNSDYDFGPEEEYNLLVKLKTRCTASEIRVLTRRASEKFDFLSKLDSTQVYDLVKDEKIQVQAIVLTQLDRKKRSQVFAMYVGDTKVSLMNELSSAEAIPKEFLFNVAKVLTKKITGRPEFDTENLRTSDILIDLLEKSPLNEQKALMKTLQANNQETFRSIKMKLVTIHMLPFLKDGHLLELILGMDREDLLIFLAEVEDGIRDLILRKAPEELSDSWIEDMENMASIDENAYRLTEMKVLNRIRNLANNGVISLLDINTMIFDDGEGSGDFASDHEPIPQMNGAFDAA